ncbi:hypothetical protein JVU11DRAFT_795 [Chiua virens]|nr:hypothetical protein JVU11DRAFT_795 [Chiua virens]
MPGPATNEQTIPRQDPEFDFWDFTEALPQYRFGLLNVAMFYAILTSITDPSKDPDQSCTKCGDQAIQLVPLQRNIDPPMSEWFRSLSFATDSIANAIRFQQESLAALVRYYRNQCLQLSSTCDRLRNERRSLRKEIEVLQRELHLCRGRGVAMEQSREPSAHLNHNGKRIMDEVRGVKTNSSPRSIPTPLGPLRLTRLPGEHPSFSQQGLAEQNVVNTVDRPGSSRFIEQYAYHGDDNPPARAHPPTDTTNDQRLGSTSLRQPRLLDMNHGMMAPLPPPDQGKRFPVTSQQIGQRAENLMSYDFEPQRITKACGNMGPPPTPQRPFSAALRTPSRVLDLPMQSAVHLHQPSLTLQPNRFMPSSSHSRPLPGPTPTVTSTARNVGKVSGGNRMPFIPQSSNGFG